MKKCLPFLLLLPACGAPAELDVKQCEVGEEAACAEEAAPRAAAGAVDPGAPGARRTVRFDLSVPLPGGGALQTTVTAPSDDGQTVSMMGAPFPVVVFSPGFAIPRSQYHIYGARLASHGILTVSQTARNEANHAQYRDQTRALLDWLAAPAGRDAPRLAGRIDAARMGVAGHSLGGKISALTASADAARSARIRGVFLIDPVDGGSGPLAAPDLAKLTLPVGILGETLSKSGGFMPCAPAGRNFETFFQAAPAASLAIQFLKAAHGDFVENYGSCFACGLCGGGTSSQRPVTRTRDLAVKYTAAYFLWTLRGAAGALEYLRGAPFQSDAQTGDVKLLSR